MEQFRKVKNLINGIRLGREIPDYDFTKEEGDILYMLRVTGFVSINEGVNYVQRHIPGWLEFDHLDFLINTEDKNEKILCEEGHLNTVELSGRIFEFGMKEKEQDRYHNVTFTRPGKYTYTYEKAIS